ncbi:phosphoserine phosphatase isoform X1 [Galleria mellonella]|uniref:Phosphoserine phosphatase n=2 Tax=Galleria mellonella TaxID=7137 RepID=A0A3G1T178_GALME|nr:phosphoserine phosphatase isoform X1 [Galleria mellonella]AXY94723.1 phosphoserine phosphatase [Galleria mellonella]
MALYSLKNNLQYATLKTLSLVSISVMSPQQSVQEIFRTADCVCFDVDSTVIQDEGIDELANFCGKGDEVKRLTAEAMGGNMTFQEALKKRLDIIRPSVSQVQDFLDKFPVRLTPGISQLVKALQERGVTVYLVSGGFRSLIEPVAEKLGIPSSHIFANRLKFYFNGEYAGFDENEPTSRSGGKGLVIRRLKEQHGYQRLIMIGDGATDAEACPPADGFIGFGGNVTREEVRKKASWYVTDFQELVQNLTIQTK